MSSYAITWMTFLSTLLLERPRYVLVRALREGRQPSCHCGVRFVLSNSLRKLTSSNYAELDVRVHDLVHLQSADLVILGPTWTPGRGSTSICRCIEVGHVLHGCTCIRHSQAGTHTHVHIHTYTHMHTCTHTPTHACTRAHTTHVHVCTHTNTHTHTNQ